MTKEAIKLGTNMNNKFKHIDIASYESNFLHNQKNIKCIICQL